MAPVRKSSKKVISLPVGISIGVLLCFATALLGGALVAYLIGNETIPESGMNASCGIILMVSAAIGSLLAAKLTGRQRLPVCGATAGCFFCLLLCMTALFFGGQYQGLGAAALFIMTGAALAILPVFLQKKSGNRKGRRKAFR